MTLEPAYFKRQLVESILFINKKILLLKNQNNLHRLNEQLLIYQYQTKITQLTVERVSIASKLRNHNFCNSKNNHELYYRRKRFGFSCTTWFNFFFFI